MDFKLFYAVVKRYKRVVISGAVLAIVLSVLSYGMPGLKGGKPTIIPRGSEVWQGDAEILISEEGFPYGRAVTQVIPGKGVDVPAQTYGDESYLSNLSSVYAAMANGNALQQEVAKDTHFAVCPAKVTCGTILAAEVADPNTSAPLPLVTITASAPTAGEAAKLATTTVSVLKGEITQQEAASGTPVDQRVELQTLKSGSPATLSQGYSKSIPMLVLFAVLSASIALAFILNNHSEDPVRSTRRHLDEGLGGLTNGTGNGRMAEAERGLLQTRGGRTQLIGVRRGASGTRLANEENSAHRAVAEESATDRRWAWSDRTPPHSPRVSGIEPESRD
jgi:hypothetical protein